MSNISRNMFSCRFLNVLSQKYDPIKSNTISSLDELIWNIGNYDGSLFQGRVYITIESMLTDSTYLDLSFSINCTSDITYTTVFFSDLIRSNIAKYQRTLQDGTKLYFFEDKYVIDSTWWYNIWSKIEDFRLTLANKYHDLLKIKCVVFSNDSTEEFVNFIEYRDETYNDNFISGGFKVEIDSVVHDKVEYSFIFGTDKQVEGLSIAEIDYIKSRFRSYEYFLIQVDDFGNQQLILKDTVFNIGDIENGKIKKKLSYKLSDNLFIDSVMIICKVNFNETNELLRTKISTTSMKYEYSFFEPKLILSSSIGEVTIGSNVSQDITAISYIKQYINDITSAHMLRKIYDDIEFAYQIKMIDFDIDSMFVKIGIEKQYQYMLYYIIVPVMKKAISIWDGIVLNNLRSFKIYQNTILWQYRKIDNAAEFAIQLYINDNWVTIDRKPSSYMKTKNNNMYSYNLDSSYIVNNGIYKIRVMHISDDGVWTYLPKQSICFIAQNGNIISSDSWSVDDSYIDSSNPFLWETLRNIFDIPWNIWQLIIKENFYNVNYNEYKDIINSYVYENFDKYISYNKEVKFFGISSGMQYSQFKKLNSQWDNIKPFGHSVDDSDVSIAYCKFKLDGYPSIYLKTLFLYCEPYYFNDKKVVFGENIDGVKAIVYRKTFAESLNNLGYPVPQDYQMLKNAIKINEDFCITNVFFKSDIIQHPSKNSIQFFEFDDSLSEFLSSNKYNENIKNENFFVIFFINNNIYNRHHVRFSVGCPTGVTLNKDWWDNRHTGDVDKIRSIDNFVNKSFDKQTVYWADMPKYIVDKYNPTKTTDLTEYINIDDNDINSFYNFTELVSINSIKYE